MKRIFINILILTLILTTIGTRQIFAAAVSENEKPSSPSGVLDRIEKIKELVASRVAELKLVEKRGILGSVKESSNTQIALEDSKGQIRIFDIDELTKFEESGNKDFGISDIKKGDLIAGIGLYNKDTKRQLCRVVSRIKGFPIQFDGIVASSNSRTFQIEVVSEKGDKKTVDVERSTKISVFGGSGLSKSGFSKVTEGQRILVTGFYDLQDKNLIVGSRIIHFTDVPPSAEMKNHSVGNDANSQDEVEKTTPTPIKTVR